MSDTDALRDLFTDWGRGEFRTGVALFSDEVRFSGTQPEGQVEAQGKAGIRDFMRRFLPEWENYRVEVHELEDLGGDRYIATGTQRATGKESRIDITAPVHIAIAMSGGKITLLGFFAQGRDDALAALAE